MVVPSPRPVLIVGSGVSGLSCGVRLQEAGIPALIRAREPAGRTTSSVAAALWYPFHGDAGERMRRWARIGWEELSKLVGISGTGAMFRDGVHVDLGPGEGPWAADAGPPSRAARADELPAGYTRGVAFRTVVCEMPVYLAWLVARFEELGGAIELGTVASLDSAIEDHDVVVNCTGLGARELAGDGGVFPIRGQIVRVERDGFDRVLLDERDHQLTYVVPRSTDCVLGGTAQVGDERALADDADTAGIMERCARLDPGVAAARRSSVAVGFRPGRAEVRLEAEEPRPGKLVVHDYGHGGAGVTLSWGCAADVAAIVRRNLAS